MAASTGPLARGGTKTVRSAVVPATAVASTALTAAWARAATAGSPKKRLLAGLDRVETEIALLREELDIKGHRGVKLELVLRVADERKHLAIVELKLAA